MNISNIDFLRKAHRPIYFKATLNKMRNGDTLSLGSIVVKYPTTIFDNNKPQQEDSEDSFNAYAQAYITKEEKGIYAFTGLWTIPSSNKRADIWTTGKFTIEKGMFQLNDSEKESLNLFFLVCRYINRLIKSERQSVICYEDYKKTWFYSNGIPFYFDGFWFDKHNTSVLRTLVFDKDKNDRVHTKVQLSKSFSEKVVRTPPLLAILEKGIAMGEVKFN